LEDEGFVGCSVFVELGSVRFDIDVVNEVEGDVFDIVEIIIVISEGLEIFLTTVEACTIVSKEFNYQRLRNREYSHLCDFPPNVNLAFKLQILEYRQPKLIPP
jgi:hypothetical protein